MNVFIKRGNIPCHNTYLGKSENVNLDDGFEDDSKEKVIVFDMLKMRIPNRSISHITLEKMKVRF